MTRGTMTPLLCALTESVHLSGSKFSFKNLISLEKIVIACLGKYLSKSGIDLALIESGVFGQGVVEASVMQGGHYVKGKEGMAMIAEGNECFTV